jgi:hypothetical protein
LRYMSEKRCEFLLLIDSTGARRWLLERSNLTQCAAIAPLGPWAADDPEGHDRLSAILQGPLNIGTNP